MTTVNWHLRILSGLLLSLIWVGANYVFTPDSRAAPPSVLAQTVVVTTPMGVSPGPPSTLSTLLPSPGKTKSPLRPPAGATTTRAIAVATPHEVTPEHPTNIDQPIPTVTSSPPITRASVPPRVDPPISGPSAPQEYANSMTGRQYRYFERSQEVTALQMELGMRSVDGVYGPQTRKAHIRALGGPTAAVYRFYPEIGQTPIPCSPAQEPEKTCLPGDGHYELPTLGSLIHQYFEPEDWNLAHKIAFCESSGRSWDTGSAEVSSALAIGWIQHLAKYWVQRSERAGWKDYDPFNGRANVAVAAWLYYTSGVHHWNPSRTCWEGEVL